MDASDSAAEEAIEGLFEDLLSGMDGGPDADGPSGGLFPEDDFEFEAPPQDPEREAAEAQAREALAALCSRLGADGVEWLLAEVVAEERRRRFIEAPLDVQYAFHFRYGPDALPESVSGDPALAPHVARWREIWAAAAEVGRRAMWDEGARRRCDTAEEDDGSLSWASRDWARRTVAEAQRHQDAFWEGQPRVRTEAAHFLEDLGFLDAAVSTGFPVYVLRYKVRRDDDRFACWAFNTRDDFDISGKWTVWGAGGRPPVDGARHAVFPNNDSYCMTERYWKLRCFLDGAGRLHVPCKRQHLPAVLALMAAAGHARAFVKAGAPKVGVWTVGLRPEDGQDAIAARLAAEMGTRLLAYDGPYKADADHFVVQEHVPMAHEYRFFVVDDRIVSGAPVRREDTLLDRMGRGRLDPRTSSRQTGGEVAVDRARVAAYARRARAFVREVKREWSGLRHYVLDLADFGPGRGVHPIELNSLSHAGLYANDPGRILGALTAVACRHAAQGRGDGEGRRPVVARAVDRLASGRIDALNVDNKGGLR